jgi:predicted ATPase
MIKKITLNNFKNFRNAELQLGRFSVLVGTNASGKSNLRDAFRFIHGLSRGYTLAETIGAKYVEGGVLQWSGLRGGTRELVFDGGSVFGLKIDFVDTIYEIKVNVGSNGKPPCVTEERLVNTNDYLFDSHAPDDPPMQEDTARYIFVRLPRDAKNRKHGQRLQFLCSQPILTQIAGSSKAAKPVVQAAKSVIAELESMRFLDLSPDAMRMPSLPGQNILGDRGENLSSVLQDICANPQTKDAVISWIKDLTPLDVKDFEFIPDQTGKILTSLIESGGRKTSAYSASDGTLRFLAMIAAVLGSNPAQFYFFEELENGIHPTRLYLLLQLIEQKVLHSDIQIVATSHSPQLLGFLDQTSRENASLVYRLEGRPDAGIQRIMDIPEAKRVLQAGDLARLHSTGWLENAVEFANGNANTGAKEGGA